MAYIRRSSATIATLFTHCIIFVIVAAFNFTIVDNVLPINFAYGLALVLLSMISLLLSITAQDPDLALLRSLLMCISAMWTSVGLFHMVETYTTKDLTDSEALFAGYGTFLLAFLFFTFGALYHRDRFTAVLALGMFLSSIFEIAGLWRPVHRSAAAYYLLLALITLYLTVSRLYKRFRNGESKSKAYNGEEEKASKDFIPMAHMMNTLAASVYAGQVTGIFNHASLEFHWVAVAGFYQLVAAVVAVRRKDIYNGLYFIFHGTFWITNGFNLGVVFITGEEIPFNLVAATVIHFIIFFIIALISLTREIYQLPQNLALCVLCVAILVNNNDAGAFLGAMGWILFVFSLYGLAAHISRVKNSGFKLPLGTKVVDPEKIANAFLSVCKCCASHVRTIKLGEGKSNSLFSTDFSLGYSRYGGFDLAGFALNAIAAVAILWTPEGLWVLPWAVIMGGLAQMIVGSICFSKGLSFESCAFFTFGSLWLIWGPARGLGNLALDNSPAIITGLVGFLAVGLLLLGLSATINKAWMVLTFFFNLIIIGLILHSVNANGSFIYEIVIHILFVIVCIYTFLATAMRSVWGKELLPLGKPPLQVSFLHSQGERAFWADGRKASGVKDIAEIMNRGGICGIPTDTVYVLVAACKFPAAVERAYNTKKSAEDRPMSMWISKAEQLEAGRPLFGELVWGLMNEIWPSTVSLVVPKGEWLQSLGIGESEKYIGRPDSIACRMPDNTVTSHLIDQTGPVAVSSANPTGEADTTHHLQVIAKLGIDNCDGILCSGPSPENMASTVVDCRSLATDGQLAFFRIGVVPRSQVEAVFAKVKAYHLGIPASIEGMPGGPMINEAFEDEDNDSHIYDGNGSGGDNDSGHIPSNTASLNVSFGDDDAQLIRPNSSSVVSGENGEVDTPSEPNGISGHVNQVYESLNHRASRASSRRSTNSTKMNNRYGSFSKTQSTTIRSQILDSEGESDKASTTGSAGSDPYEPMAVMGSQSKADLVKAAKEIGGKTNGDAEPAFKVNPLYDSVHNTRF